MIRWLVAILVTVALGVGVAYAAGLGGVSSPGFGSSSDDVVAPPVVVTGFQWVLAGGEVAGVKLTLDRFPSGPTVTFDVWLTLEDSTASVLFDSAISNHVSVDGSPVSTTFNLVGSGVAPEAVEGVTVTACKHVSGHADKECK